MKLLQHNMELYNKIIEKMKKYNDICMNLYYKKRVYKNIFTISHINKDMIRYERLYNER